MSDAVPFFEAWRLGRSAIVVGRAVPAATAMAALAFDVLPLPDAAPQTAMPATFLCVVFFWTIYRPDLLGPVLILILASLLDAIAGLPLGLSALAFLAVRTAAMPRERNFASTSFVIVWASFVLAAMAVLGLRWAIACLWFAHWFDLQPVAVELALTVASYPPIAYMLTKLRPLVAKVPHVSGS